MHCCPITCPADTTQSTTAPVPVLLIRHSTLLFHYQDYWYDTVHCCPRTSPIDTTQYTVSVDFSPSTCATETPQSTIAPVPVLLIRHSTLLTQYQSYCYDTLHDCSNTYSTNTIQYTSPPVPVLLNSPLLPQYQSYCYDTAHFCPITISVDTRQYTTPPFPIPLSPQLYFCPITTPTKRHSPLLSQYKSYWYDTVHNSPGTSPTDRTGEYCPITRSIYTIHSTAVPVPVLLIRHSTLLSQYQSYPTYTTQSTTVPVPVLQIRYTTLLPQYQSYL